MTTINVETKATIKEQVGDVRFLGGVYQDIENQFRKIDYSDVFKQFHRVLEQVHAGYFETGTGPSGEAWAPLAPSTVARKGHARILIDKGPLRRSLTAMGAGIRETTHRGLIFGTSVDYSRYHQEGTTHIPQREHVGMNERTLGVLLEGVADKTVEGLKLRV